MYVWGSDDQNPCNQNSVIEGTGNHDKRWTTHVFEVNISVQEDGIRIAKSVLKAWS